MWKPIKLLLWMCSVNGYLFKENEGVLPVSFWSLSLWILMYLHYFTLTWENIFQGSVVCYQVKHGSKRKAKQNKTKGRKQSNIRRNDWVVYNIDDSILVDMALAIQIFFCLHFEVWVNGGENYSDEITNKRRELKIISRIDGKFVNLRHLNFSAITSSEYTVTLWG